MDGRDIHEPRPTTSSTRSADSPADAAPYAVPDLGGSSTQAVFEPDNADNEEAAFKDGEHKAPTSPPRHAMQVLLSVILHY